MAVLLQDNPNRFVHIHGAAFVVKGFIPLVMSLRGAKSVAQVGTLTLSLSLIGWGRQGLIVWSAASASSVCPSPDACKTKGKFSTSK